MSATPARDAWVELAQDGHHSDGLVYADTHVDASLARPDLVLAALIESGWRPTDDQLRLMGGRVSQSSALYGTHWEFRRTEEATDV